MSAIQSTQGLILPKEKGTVIHELNRIGTTRYSAYISENETEVLVAGSYVERDITASGSKNTIKVKRASVTTPADLVYMVVRSGPMDDFEFENIVDKIVPNSRTKDNVSIIQLNGLHFVNEVADVVEINDILMIDDTDATRSTLIPYVDNGTNIPLVRAEAESTAAGQIISLKTIK